MSSVPATAKKPQDHKAPVVAAVIPEDELLATLPELASPLKLRLRQRNRLMKLALSLRSLVPEGAEEIDTDNLADEDLVRLLDVLADVDEFAESIAVDKEAYVAWAQAASYEHFTAILGRYSSAVGESSGS